MSKVITRQTNTFALMTISIAIAAIIRITFFFIYVISNDFQYLLIFFDTYLKLEFEPTKACAVSAKILQHFEPTTISTIKVAHLIVVDIITKCISNPTDYPMIVCNLQKTKVDTWTILFLINGCMYLIISIITCTLKFCFGIGSTFIICQNYGENI